MIGQVEAGEKFVKRFEAIFPVKAAFWLKGSEDPRWYLYIVSEAINDTNSSLGYREVLGLARAAPDFYIDPYQLRVVGADNPVARAAIEIQERYPELRPMRYRGPQLGGVGTEEVYIYPSPVVVPGR